MEFDSNGRIILPGLIKEDKERDSGSIIIEKIQVNMKNPAVAQLKVQIGQELKNRINEEALVKEIYYFCKQFMDKSWRFNDVESSIKMIGSSVLIETRSSFQMYGFLEAIIEEMRELYVRNKGIGVSVRGEYSHF